MRLVILAIALALAGGCKKKQSEGQAAATGAATATADLGPMDPIVAEVHTGLKKYRDEMCACKDIGCADGVQILLGQWILENKDRFSAVDQKSTPAQIEAAKKISGEHDACAKKLAGH